ncbi:hypothetical protein [Nonomuraea endophytica]|uniref:Ada DNA repair metal-binding domain-containing protein n=1 Tax=Nonomuraea endophytica TaxID=714136 RepID=A0A7W8A090_9ACTN|nr:hypothetical protein [Nonomuraea endophytica]MBB5077116.1 hypothetical protein [Nonomuraea endophytica]
MILISAGLVLAAVVLLIAGFVLAKPFLIMWSIVVSVLSALFLVIGALLRRHELFPGGRAGATATPPEPAKFGYPQPPHSDQAPAGAPPSPPRTQTFQQTATIPSPAPRRPAARGISPDALVLVIPGRKRYHVPGCRQLIGRDHEELTFEEAREEGFTPCTSCLPDAALGGRQLPPAADPEPVTPHPAASPETRTVSAELPAEPSEATRDLRPAGPVAAPKPAPAASTPTPESGPDQPGGWFAPKASSSGTAKPSAAGDDTPPAPGPDDESDAETTNPHLRLPAMDSPSKPPTGGSTSAAGSSTSATGSPTGAGRPASVDGKPESPSGDKPAGPSGKAASPSDKPWKDEKSGADKPERSALTGQGPSAGQRPPAEEKIGHPVTGDNGAGRRPEAPVADEGRPTGKSPSGPRVAPYVAPSATNGEAKPAPPEKKPEPGSRPTPRPGEESGKRSATTSAAEGKPEGPSPEPEPKPRPAAEDVAGDVAPAKDTRPGTVKVIVGTRRYHSTACPLIRGAGDTGVETMTLAQAEAAGLTSCSVCQNDRESVS